MIFIKKISYNFFLKNNIKEIILLIKKNNFYVINVKIMY